MTEVNMTDFADLAMLALLAAITWLCRVAGFAAMRYIPFTPPVRRGLEALPGSVMAAVIIPGILGAGVPGLVGVVIALLTMAFIKKDLFAMVFGCAAAALCRAWGF